MDPAAVASSEPAVALPADDSILDTLGTEVLAAMLCVSSPSARPHATLLWGHSSRSPPLDGRAEAHRRTPRPHPAFHSPTHSLTQKLIDAIDWLTDWPRGTTNR
jgi:hypothetical protein